MSFSLRALRNLVVVSISKAELYHEVHEVLGLLEVGLLRIVPFAVRCSPLSILHSPFGISHSAWI